MNRSTAGLRMQIRLIALLALVLLWSAVFYEISRQRRNVLSEAEIKAVADAHVFAEFADANIRRLNELLLDLRSQWRGDENAFAER